MCPKGCIWNYTAQAVAKKFLERTPYHDWADFFNKRVEDPLRFHGNFHFRQAAGEFVTARQNPHPASFPERAPESYRKHAKDSRPLLAVFDADPVGEEEDSEALADPIGEAAHAPTPFLVRKFRDRALYLASNSCAVHCRFCFRRASGLFSAPAPGPAELALAAAWIRAREEISEIILSGGDPLMLDAASLTATLDAFGNLPNVKKLRIHTRRPVVEAAAISGAMLAALARSPKPLSIVLHIAHPAEATGEVVALAARLRDIGIATSSQTVLLAFVNDDVALLRDLFARLSETGLPSRYLHHPDRVSGAARFRVPIERGLELYAGLKGAQGLPAYILDLPDGSGKTPVERLIVAGRENRDGKKRRKYRWERPAGWDGVKNAESYEWWDIWTREG